MSPSPPTHADLQEFINGSLSGSRRAEIETYLDGHPELLATLDQITRFEHFRTEYLTGAHPGLPAGSPQLTQLITRLKSLPAPGAGPEDLTFLDTPITAGAPGKLGDFEILAPIARGGMGVVLRANDPNLDRPVAIKALSPDLAAVPQARDLFLSEARAAAALEHPNILPIHAVHPGHGVPYFVMPLVGGKNLHDLVATGGTLPFNRLVNTGIQVASAIAAAHAKGIIHRDIKPANILTSDSGQHIWVTDFGIAQVGDAAPASPRAGTPGFTAPEVLAGQPATPASDLYSLGALLRFLSTADGARPQGPLASLINSLLSESPTSRPENATAVAARLRSIRRRRRLRPPAIAAATLVAAALITAAATPRGLTGWTNHLLTRATGHPFSRLGHFGVHGSLPAALAATSAGDTILVDTDAQIVTPHTTVTTPVTIAAAPGKRPALTQHDRRHPLLTTSADTRLEGMMLVRNLLNNDAPSLLTASDNSTLTLERCRLLQNVHNRSNPDTPEPSITLKSGADLTVRDTLILTVFSNWLGILDPNTPDARYEVDLYNTAIASRSINVDLPPSSTASFTLSRSSIVGSNLVSILPASAGRTEITAGTSVIATGLGLVRAPGSSIERLTASLSYRGDRNLYQNVVPCYLRLSAHLRPGAGKDGTPVTVAGWQSLPFVTDPASLQVRLPYGGQRVITINQFDGSFLRWFKQLQPARKAHPDIGLILTELPILPEAPDLKKPKP